MLGEIFLNKRKEIEILKNQTAYSDFEKSIHFSRRTFSLSEYIINPAKSGIIAEFKRKSPSGGVLNPLIDVEYVANGYSGEGASGLSILTDDTYFGGSCADILKIRDHNNIPILRKEFIIDELQVVESKAAGADAILLIASILTKEQLLRLASLSRSLKMEVMLEIHSEEEIVAVNDYVDIIGVNNRDLTTMKTSVENSFRLAARIPEGFIKVSESGISEPGVVIELRNAGFDGFLIGEHFMRKPDPVSAFSEFAKKVM